VGVAFIPIWKTWTTKPFWGSLPFVQEQVENELLAGDVFMDKGVKSLISRVSE